ncbi:helix-turn-helix transcriptional regulator [Nocardiopsis dassonvillei]|uniref:helix-turn-helix domain-containing protein n=1 Tax=Nocardiopsis dassonvillei TaxID=2014 RepID=UPI00200C6858|nr:helix-turn-helix transcriptional regulator [Nocardiopsis dassonvillei]MCK9870310.1 helix-turn-helix transcriptional regulator [Nocardiopsis dassonvillei]
MGNQPDAPHPSAEKFAKALVQARKNGGLTQLDLAQAAGCSRPTVARYESGRHLPPADLAQAFDDALGAGDYLVSQLPHPSPERERMERLKRFVEMEKSASHIRQFQCQVVPGLQQTPEYARAVLGASIPPKGTAEIDLMVAQRLERQQILDQEHPPWLHFIIDEGALRRMVGSPTVMVDQWGHLLEATERTNITVQVMPFSEGAHADLIGSYTLMETELHGTIQYLETLATGNIVTDPSAIALARARFDSLATNALSEKTTRTLLRELIKETT